MKRLFLKWLSALLVAALLLPSVALMEETSEPLPDAVEAIVEAVADEAAEEIAEADAEEAPAEEVSAEPVDVVSEAVDEAVLEADEAVLDESFEQISQGEDDFMDRPEEAVEETEAAEDAVTELAFAAGPVAVDPANFPDDTFRAYVSENFDADKDGSLSEEEINNAYFINYYGTSNYYNGVQTKTGIASLQGIEYLTNLQNLNVGNCPLTAVDLSQNTRLMSLYLNNCDLTELDISQNTELRGVGVSGNKIKSLNVSNCTFLERLDVSMNNIEVLDISNCSETIKSYVDVDKYYQRTQRGWNIYVVQYGENATDPGGHTYFDARLSCDEFVTVIGGVNAAEPVSRGIAIDEALFPDAELRRYFSNSWVDTNRDGYLNDSEIENVYDLYISGNWDWETQTEVPYEVEDLTGIEIFANLESFHIKSPVLKALDFSGNTKLARFGAFDCPALTSVNLNGCTALENIEIWETGVSTVELDGCASLEHIDITGSKLKTLDLSAFTKLVRVDVRRNQLTRLDLPVAPNLEEVLADTNSLESLDVSGCPIIVEHIVDTYRFESDGIVGYEEFVEGTEGRSDYTVTYLTYDQDVQLVGVTPRIGINETNFPDAGFRRWLAFRFGNSTTSLSEEMIEQTEYIQFEVYNDETEEYEPAGVSDLTGIKYFTNLKNLDVSGNTFETLDVSGLTDLESLNCSNSGVQTLILGNNPNLREIQCFNNPLTSVDLSGCSKYKQTWDQLDRWITTMDDTTVAQYNGHNDDYSEYSNIFADTDTSVIIDGVDYKMNLLAVDETMIPDAKFREALEHNGFYDKGFLMLDRIADNPRLSLRYWDSEAQKEVPYGVTDLTGIEYLADLTSLDISGNAIKALDVSALVKLEYLNADDCGLETLILGDKPNLTSLQVKGNGLPTVDLDHCSKIKSLLNPQRMELAYDEAADQLWIQFSEYDGEWYTLTWDKDTQIMIDGVDQTPNIVAVDEVNFPDPVLRAYFLENYDRWNSGYILPDTVRNISLYQMDENHNLKYDEVTHQPLPIEGIQNLKGIEYFTSAESLAISGIPFGGDGVLDLSAFANLNYLECSDCGLNALILGHKPNLTTIRCYGNDLSNVDLSGCDKIKARWNGDNIMLSSAWMNGPATAAFSYYNSGDYMNSIYVTWDPLGAVTIDGTVYKLNLLAINEENFPDAELRNYLTNTYDYSKTGYLSETTVNNISYLNVGYTWGPTGPVQYEVEDLTGIELFPNLRSLQVSSPKIEAVDLSGNTQLEILTISNSPALQSVNVSNCTALTSLSVLNTGMTTLDVKGCDALNYLGVIDNALTALDVSANLKLTGLECGNNKLTALDVSKNAKLEELWCGYNDLTSLDASNLPNLGYVDARHNSLKVVNVDNDPQLERLLLDNNQLTSVDVSGSKTIVEHISDTYRKETEDGIVGYEEFIEGTEGRSDSTMTYLTVDKGVEVITAYQTKPFLIRTAVTANGASGTVDVADAAFEGDTVTVTLTPDENCVAVGVAVSFGDTELEVTEADGTYTFTMPAGNVTVTGTFKQIPAVTAPTAAEGLVYNGQPQALIAAGATTGGTLEYSLDGETWSAELPTGINADSYSVTYRVTGDDGFADVEAAGPVEVSIAKRPLAVTVTGAESQPLTKVYGDADPAVTLTYDAEALAAGDALSGEPVRAEGENVGSYDYAAGTVTAGDNYEIAVGGSLTVTVKPVTVTWTNTELSYNGYGQKPAAEAVGLKDGDAVSVIVTGEQTDAGTWTAVAASLSSANYALPADAADRSTEYTIAKAAHEDEVAGKAVTVSFEGIESAEMDLAQWLADAENWSVDSTDGTFITSAERVGDAGTRLTYTAARADEETTRGSVVVKVTTKNYEDYKLTIEFVTSDVFTLRFESNGGPQESSRKLHGGEAYGELPASAWDGHTFEGWFADADCTVPVADDAVMGSADTTVYAKWTEIEYTVTLKLDGHGAIPEGFATTDGEDGAKVFTYKVGDPAIELPVLADVDEGEESFTFAGWLKEGEETAQINVTVTPADMEEPTYTAQWIKGVKVGAVTFEQAEDNALMGVADMSGESASTGSDSPTSKLAEAMKEIACQEDAEEVADKVVTVEMTIKANSEDAAAVEAIQQQVADPEAAEEATDKTDFLEININKTIVAEATEEEPEPVAETEAVAQTPRVLEIALQYNLSGRYNPTVFRFHDQAVQELKRLASRPKDFQKLDGCFFISGVGADAIIYVYSNRFSTAAVNTNLVPTCQVLFEANGGTEIAQTDPVTAGEKVAKPEDPTKAGGGNYSYRFTGWYTDEACTNPYDFETPVEADMTLYAGWKQMAGVEIAIEGYTGVYDGEAHGVTPDPELENYDLVIYYSTEAPLNGDNYQTGSTEIPTATDMGETTVYWYVQTDNCVPTPDHGEAVIKITGLPVTLTTAPTGRALIYNGEPQALAVPGVAVDGTLMYRLDESEFGTAIPTAVQPGTYIVYYKVKGDPNHEDLVDEENFKVVTTIATPAVPETPVVVEPAGPTIQIIPVLKKSVKATASVGTLAQIELNGAVGKSFKSSKKKVATVSKTGLITPKSKGKTKITFKVGKKKRTLTLTVKDPTIPKSITLNMSGTVAAKKGEQVTLTYTLPEGTKSGVKWTSSNKKIATVKNGVVTFKKAGKVTITATCTRGKKKAKVKFKVTK